LPALDGALSQTSDILIRVNERGVQSGFDPLILKPFQNHDRREAVFRIQT
jgi:hypothetical protein